ncbi:MAG: hypothetical protein HDR09_20140 [Lachnospiraceae bacterium]|nr:hypothetical protein [Lachnospiraceae bacterium]MBD5505986.1 hypothetical protein [Lachnospiraceae bacterium]
MRRVLPILFNTEMVQAILDGRKKATRRIVKSPYFVDDSGAVPLAMRTAPKGGKLERQIGAMPYPDEPYKIDDILYVRETWSFIPCIECTANDCCDKIPSFFEDKDTESECCYIYRAGFPEYADPKRITWRPSIHMPKEAARIWLKVTDVRVERLQEVTKEKIKNEGIYDDGTYPTDKKIKIRPDIAHLCGEWTDKAYKERFAMIWDSTIKKPDISRYGWLANPWVWVIEFERCEKPREERS